MVKERHEESVVRSNTGGLEVVGAGEGEDAIQATTAALL